jgi:hypothetical protein
MSLETLENSLNFTSKVHQIPSYQTVVISFISCFVENVRCTCTHIVYQENITFLFLKLLTTTAACLHSCNNNAVTSIIIVSQASFFMVTHYAHASVIAWWLKTKALDI